MERYGLKRLRLGDVVAIRDHYDDCGRGRYEGAVAIGVVIHGFSRHSGRGRGVNPVLSALPGRIKTRLNPKANASYYLGISAMPQELNPKKTLHSRIIQPGMPHFFTEEQACFLLFNALTVILNATGRGALMFNTLKMDEQELIARVQAGDEAAFARILGLYKDRIVNFLYHLTGDYEKAVDLSQETFLRVYFKADKYKPVAALSCWIYTIASNLAKTELKKRRRALVVPLEDVQNDLQSGAFCEDAQDTGLARNLKAALDALNPRYRVPVVLKDVEGYSQEEIAAIVKKPVGTVKARISRGRHMLRRALEKSVSGARGIALSKEFENGRV